MIFFINTKLKLIDKHYYINFNGVNLMIDKLFINNPNLDLVRNYYFFKHQEINYKNKYISRLYCFNSQLELDFFIFLNDIQSIGINTIENIFKIGIDIFIDDIKNLQPFEIKQKYQLKENQILNIYKQFKLVNKNEIKDKQKDIIINNLVSLGFNKTKVQSIINHKYDLFKNKEMNFVIKKFVEILKNESEAL